MRQRFSMRWLALAAVPQISALWACSGSGNGTGSNQVDFSQGLANAIAVDSSGSVYIVGVESDVSATSSLPLIWENGSPNFMDDLAPEIESAAIAVTVDSAGNIYSAGFEEDTLNVLTPEYWKGTKPRALSLTGSTYTNGDSNAFGITTSSSGVFVAGFQQAYGGVPQTPTYWKNGSPVTLSTANSSNGQAFAAPSDSSGNVYVVGSENGSSLAADVPVVWIISSSTVTGPIVLPNVGSDAGGQADAIAVDGLGNVYIVGDQVNATAGTVVPSYWVAMTSTIARTGGITGGTLPLDSSSNYSNGAGVGVAIHDAVSTATPCIVGFEMDSSDNTVPVVWSYSAGAFSAASILSFTGSGYAVGSASGVATDSAGNVYVSGYEGTATSATPVYWKNGSPSALPVTQTGGIVTSGAARVSAHSPQALFRVMNPLARFLQR